MYSQKWKLYGLKMWDNIMTSTCLHNSLHWMAQPSKCDPWDIWLGELKIIGVRKSLLIWMQLRHWGDAIETTIICEHYVNNMIDSLAECWSLLLLNDRQQTKNPKLKN